MRIRLAATVTALAVGLVILSSCGRFERSRPGSRSQSPDKKTTYGSGLKVPGLANGPSPTGPVGTLVIDIVDQNQRNPEGISVAFLGPTQATLRSDSKGIIRFNGAPGAYELAVQVGCSDGIEVLAGGTATAAVVEGREQTGRLMAVWRQRIAPGPPIFSSSTPYWPVGNTIQIRYDVVDRCLEEARAPEAVYPTFVFRTGAILKVEGTPKLQADAKGFGHLQVVCTDEGTPELNAEDTRNPRDRLDMIANDSTSGISPRCQS